MHIFIDKYLGGGRSALAWKFGCACCLRGFLFGRWKLGVGVLVLRFLWCWFRVFFLKRFIGRSGCVGISEGVGCVRGSAMVSKGSRRISCGGDVSSS